MNALQFCRWQLSHKNFLAEFLPGRAILYRKRPFCVFEPPLGGGGVGATNDNHRRLIGKRVVDFLLVLIELFFARCYG